jgi:hypothetical protein
MSSNKKIFFDWLYRSQFRDEILFFDDILGEAAVKCFGMDSLSAEAFVTGAKVRFWNWTIQCCEADRKLGLTPIFDIIDKESRKVIWLPYSAKLGRRESLKLSSRPRILREIDKVNDRQYEALACVVGRLLGATKWHLTPKGNEGGIDIFLAIPRPQLDHIFGGTHVPLRIIGQTKQYNAPVQVGAIREFITAISDVRSTSYKLRKIVPPWFYGSQGPVIGWFVAHSGLQDGAQDICKNHGIIYSSSVDLAEIAAYSRGLPEFEAPSRRAAHLRTYIDRILKEFDD